MPSPGRACLFCSPRKRRQRTPQEEKIPERPTFPTDFNAYLRIGPDGKVTGFVGKIEMGQGSRTVLSQLIADELDVEYDSVEMVMVGTRRFAHGIWARSAP